MHVFKLKNSLYDMHSEVFQAAFVDLLLFHHFFFLFFFFNMLRKLSLNLSIPLQISYLLQTDGLLAPFNLITMH